MERRHQVFISSTYTDLVDERREVIQALLEMDCFPAGMELFPAANDDQWTLIKSVIDQSDYYLVIVGGRYGSTTAEGVSYTEKEYDYAVQQGIPVMGFVHADPDAIPSGKTDLSDDARAKLDAFREKVMTRMVKPYSSAEDLGSKVTRGLLHLRKTNPMPGWVRGNQAMTSETRAEIAELKASLAMLEKDKVEEIVRTERALDLSFEHGTDTVDIAVDYSSRYKDEAYTGNLSYTWDEVVEVVGPYMIEEGSEVDLRSLLCSHILNDIYEHKDWPNLPSPRLKITDLSWGAIMVQLRAIGMIQSGTKKRTVSDKATYWKLTPAGADYLVGLRAVKRSADVSLPTA